MAKSVLITVDSTADLTPEQRERFGVSGVMPLSVMLGEESFTDGVDFSPDDVYKYYSETGKLPRTSAVAPEGYKEFFEGLKRDDCEIVHLCLSSRLSGSWQNAQIAASDMPGVFVVDTLSLCVGIGLLAIKACAMRDEGRGAEEIAREIERLRDKVKTSFMVAGLEYLSKGGRCSAVTALGANILGIKPVIEMSDGELHVGRKYRGKLQQCYEQYAADKLKNRDDLDTEYLFVAHSGISREALDGLLGAAKANSNFKEILVSRAGCTISAHCGPGTVAVIFMEK